MNKTLNNKSNLPSSGNNNSTIVNLDNSLIVEILGINNENLEYAEEHLSVQILQKGNIIIIKGNKKDRYVLRDTIIQLSEELKVPNLKYKNSFKEILNMKIKNDKETIIDMEPVKQVSNKNNYKNPAFFTSVITLILTVTVLSWVILHYIPKLSETETKRVNIIIEEIEKNNKEGNKFVILTEEIKTIKNQI